MTRLIYVHDVDCGLLLGLPLGGIFKEFPQSVLSKSFKKNRTGFL